MFDQAITRVGKIADCGFKWGNEAAHPHLIFLRVTPGLK